MNELSQEVEALRSEILALAETPELTEAQEARYVEANAAEESATRACPGGTHTPDRSGPAYVAMLKARRDTMRAWWRLVEDARLYAAQHDAASVTAYGNVDRTLSFTEVRPLTNSAADLEKYKAAKATIDSFKEKS